MNRTLLSSAGAITGGCALLCLSVFLLQGHFVALKDIREYGLPLAAEIPPLEQRASLLSQQMELSTLEASVRTDSTGEKFRTYVLPQGDNVERLLAFVESTRTFLERRQLLQSMSPIELGEPQNATIGNTTLRARTLHFTAVLRPEGRDQLLSILDLSGILTVGDVLSEEQINTLFRLMEDQNYAGIVPVERFLSADILSYVENPKLVDERLAQAFSSEEFLTSFRALLKSSRLPKVREFLQGDLGRTLVAQKLWPIQFLTVEKESVEELPGGWENVEVTVKAYARKTGN